MATISSYDTASDGLEYPPIVLSGIQPTRRVHLGHYFGAIKQHIKMHHEYPGASFFLIADYHALTRLKDPNIVTDSTLALATSYLALGLDPTKALLYRQSDVPEVCELSWILSCVSPYWKLSRAPVFKSSESHLSQFRSVGLLSYPVLQAADIFSVQATYIPVGLDQLPYIEIARDIAARFNNRFGSDLFAKPLPVLSSHPLVKGIDGRKMHRDYGNEIALFERFDVLREKVRQIVTDSKLKHERKDPATCNVFHLYSLVASPEQIDIMTIRYESGDIGYEEAKRELVLAIQEHFVPFQENYERLRDNPDYVMDVLREGFRLVKYEARAVLSEVRQLVGLRRKKAL